MRGHLLAGQPKKSSDGIEFAWLTQEEMEKKLPRTFMDGVRDLLSA